ncbi:hypothetical protein Bca4012_019469 [Brassica carinata]
MEKNLVGYRFSPTKEELINYYLKNKSIDKPWLVDDAISEINICAHDPEFLPSPEKKKKGTKRTTPTGFWKITGKPQEIRDKRGQAIGIKKTLVYRRGSSANCVKTHWVMYEYHISSLPPNQQLVICKVMYKGVDGDRLFGNNSNKLNHSTTVSVLNTVREINTAPQDEHRNNHRPKKALTGILSSDSDDAESISATVKPVGTNYYKLNWLNKIFNQDFGGRAKHTLHHSVKEGTSESVDASMDKKSSSSSPMVKTEKKGWFIKEEEAMDGRNRKNPRYIYLMNTVISFILLVSVIGNITSASLSILIRLLVHIPLLSKQTPSYEFEAYPGSSKIIVTHLLWYINAQNPLTK